MRFLLSRFCLYHKGLPQGQGQEDFFVRIENNGIVLDRKALKLLMGIHPCKFVWLVYLNEITGIHPYNFTLCPLIIENL
jgi:hypothetical protein